MAIIYPGMRANFHAFVKIDAKSVLFPLSCKCGHMSYTMHQMFTVQYAVCTPNSVSFRVSLLCPVSGILYPVFCLLPLSCIMCPDLLKYCVGSGEVASTFHLPQKQEQIDLSWMGATIEI